MTRVQRSSETRVRPAQQADLPALAALQIHSWQVAYRPFLPARFLSKSVPDILTERWSAWPGPAWRVDTLWQDTHLAGFVALDLAHKGGAYIDNLHVAPEYQGRGLGADLLAAAAHHVPEDGPLWLTVIAGNMPARRFYRRAGGVEGPLGTEELYGQRVETHPVTWDGDALRQLRAEAIR